MSHKVKSLSRVQHKSGQHKNRRVDEPAAKPEAVHNVASLQRLVGNREAQQILQRNPYGDAAQSAAPNIDLHAAARDAARHVVEASYQPVRDWLKLNTDKNRLLSAKQIVFKVRRDLPDVTRLSDLEIVRLVQTWAAENSISLPPIAILPGFGENVSADGKKELANRLPPQHASIKLKIDPNLKIPKDGQPIIKPDEIKVPIGEKLTFKLTPGSGSGAIEAEVELHPEIKKAFQVGTTEITLKLSSELTTTLDFQTRRLVSEAASHGKVEIKPFDLPIYIYGSIDGKVNFDYGERKVDKPEIKPQGGLEFRFDWP